MYVLKLTLQCIYTQICNINLDINCKYRKIAMKINRGAPPRDATRMSISGVPRRRREAAARHAATNSLAHRIARHTQHIN